MLKGLITGIVVGILLVAGAAYFYFATGHAPVATSSPNMPFERTFARMALHAYLNKLPHPEPPIPADEKNLLDGAKVYVDNCAVCHGLPGQNRTAIADGMSPRPPQLFKGTGVTDDDPWETYWKAHGGIRMTGMPGFQGKLSDQQLWQVTLLLKNADKISPAVRDALVPPAASATPETKAAAPKH